MVSMKAWPTRTVAAAVIIRSLFVVVVYVLEAGYLAGDCG
jgi:hypothetical protein